MKIHGLMLIKNESDIIEHTLASSLRWCDYIYVMDNGSTDGTWDIVHDVAARHSQIIPFERNTLPFRDSLRGVIFRAFSDNAARGDWWLRLDADEHYIDAPRSFLSKIADHHHVVWSLHYQYYLTPEGSALLEQSEDGNNLPKIDNSNLPKHFRVNGSEPRFFAIARHWNGLRTRRGRCIWGWWHHRGFA